MKHSNNCGSAEFYPKMSRVTMGTIQRDGHYDKARKYQCRQDISPERVFGKNPRASKLPMGRIDRRFIKQQSNERYSPAQLYGTTSRELANNFKPVALRDKPDSVKTNAPYMGNPVARVDKPQPKQKPARKFVTAEQLEAMNVKRVK
jgi:hypothetical protein